MLDKVTFVYLAYGGVDFCAENYFSILSLLEMSKGDSLAIAVYTDDPDYFRDLPVEARPIDESTRQAAVSGYRNKLKSLINMDALQKADSALVFCDGDTYFLKHPSSLTNKITKTTAVLHLPETRINRSTDADKQALRAALATGRVHGRGGERVSDKGWMWNSGVIGLHVDHLPSLELAIDIGDQIHAVDPVLRGVEQYALSQALEGGLSLARASNDVFHYWPTPIRRPFVASLTSDIEAMRGCDLVNRTHHTLAMRPRYRRGRRLRMRLRNLAAGVGIPLKGVPTSA